MQDAFFAAASHIKKLMHKVNELRLDMDEDSPYINSGVMLMNLHKLRLEQKMQEVFCYIEKYKNKLILPDQDVFNMLYGKQTMPIDDVIWNYDVRNYAKYLIRSTGKHDLNWVMQNTAVLHFCGKNKPWHEDYKNPFGMLYLHYRNLTMRKQYGAVLVCRTQVPRA